MKSRILKFFIVLIIVVGIITIYEFTKPTEVGEVLVKVGSLKGPTSIGMIKMIDEKQSLDTNVNVDYTIVTTNDDMLSKLETYEFDFACVPVNVAANLYNKGIKFQNIGVVCLNNLYIVGKDENIQNISDLKNKTINITSKGATPDILIQYLLKENGVGVDDPVYPTLDYSLAQVELTQAILTDKANFAVLPEPFVTQALAKNSELKILFDLQEEFEKINGENTKITQSCIVVKEEFANENPKLVKEFIEKYKISNNFVNTERETAGEISEKYGLGITKDSAGQAIKRANLTYISAKDAKEDVEKFLGILYEFAPKSIGGKIPDEGFYYLK